MAVFDKFCFILPAFDSATLQRKMASAVVSKRSWPWAVFWMEILSYIIFKGYYKNGVTVHDEGCFIGFAFGYIPEGIASAVVTKLF